MTESETGPAPFSMEDAAFFRTLIHRLRYGAGLHNRRALADIVAKTIRAETGLSAPAADSSVGSADAVTALREDGFYRLGIRLAPEVVARIRDSLGGCRLEGGEAGGAAFTRDTAPADENVGTVLQDDAFLPCGALFELANHPDILSIVDGFLGAPPTVQYYTAWWSFARRSGAREAQFFHYDRNCFRFVKLFVYLTDVPAEAGPHVYVRGSADVDDWMRRLERAKQRDPDNAQRFLDMMNALRKTDEDVVDFFGADRVETFTGRAGEAFLVDTSGIHKGLLPKSRERLAFQATYALLPLLKDGSRPVFFPRLLETCLKRHGDRLERRYIEYANRIAVTGDQC